MITDEQEENITNLVKARLCGTILDNPHHELKRITIKLVEEASEANNALTTNRLQTELADVFTVLLYAADVMRKISPQFDIAQMALEQAEANLYRPLK